MTEELITQLAGLHPARLGVIARTSIMRYKQTRKGIDQIGRELAVGYVVEGSVRRMAGCASARSSSRSAIRRISGRKATNTSWAASWQSRAKWRAPSPLGFRSSSPLPRPRLTSCTSRGATTSTGRTLKTTKKPWSISSRRWTQTRSTQRRTPESPTRTFFLISTVACRRRYAGLAGAHISLAIVKTLHDWDWVGAEAECRRAIELDPGASGPHRTYGFLLSLLGRHAQAIAEARLDRELDPLSSGANYYLALALYVARRYDEAIAQLRQLVAHSCGTLPSLRVW